MFPASTKGGGTTIAFPDVCKTPAPPAPFTPIPYPNAQYQENLRTANEVDAKARAGNKMAKKLQETAVSNLKAAMGDEAGTLKGIVSATQATMMGKTLHEGGVGKVKAGGATARQMGLVHHRQPSAGSHLAPSQTKVLLSR